jgi:hypothetical protein
MELPYRWNGTEGRVLVEVGVNDDPAALGCGDYARGFPYCTAKIEHPALGYGDMLGWVQLVELSSREGGFKIDELELLTEVTHPFAYFGTAPTLFDAPHTDELNDWDFTAHSFLCGLGGELVEFRREVRAVLGFGWGFSKRGPQIEIFGPRVLSPADWDDHREYLQQAYPKWSFAAGFRRHPLRDE